MDKIVKMAFILFSLSLLIGMTTGYVNLSNQLGPPDQYHHNYEVWVKSNTSDTFKILCPIPLDINNSKYPFFIEELKVTKGNAALSIEEVNSENSSINGKYLSITASGEVRIEWDASWSVRSGGRYMNLSGTEVNESISHFWPNAHSWVYSSIDIESFDLNFESIRIYQDMYYGGGGGPTYHTYSYDIQLSIGFQSIPIDYGEMLIN